MGFKEQVVTYSDLTFFWWFDKNCGRKIRFWLPEKRKEVGEREGDWRRERNGGGLEDKWGWGYFWKHKYFLNNF